MWHEHYGGLNHMTKQMAGALKGCSRWDKSGNQGKAALLLQGAAAKGGGRLSGPRNVMAQDKEESLMHLGVYGKALLKEAKATLLRFNVVGIQVCRHFGSAPTTDHIALKP